MNFLTRIIGIAVAGSITANCQAAWQYYKAGAEGNPSSVNCITDGNWVLPASVNAATGKISLSGSSSVLSRKVLAGEGVCDLRGVLFTLDGVDCRVTSLGNWHFYKYSGITEFHADSLESLGSSTFSGCSSLGAIDISGMATEIPNSAWDYNGFAANCPALTNVSLRLPLSYIGSKAFFNDSALSVDISNVCPDTVRKVADLCFMGCEKLTGHLKLIDVTSIGGQSFENCSKLGEITLESPYLTSTPGEVYGSNRGLFKGCTSVTNITMNCPNLASAGTGLFRGLSNAQSDIAAVCPPSVSTIGGYAYNSCSKFTGRLVLTNLNSIGTMAFTSTPGIKDIYISGGIKTFPDYNGTYNQSVFSGCGATNIVLETPGLTGLGNGSFNNASVKTITVNSTNAVAVGHNSKATSTPKFTAITILGPAWTQTSLDNMLLSVTARSGAKDCTIYVNPEQGWDDLIDTELTADEIAARPKRCLGVYVTAANARKAWVLKGVVPNGLSLMLR